MRKLINFFKYRRLLKLNKKTLRDSRPLDNKVGIEYDWIFRLYTVFMVPAQDRKEIALGYRDKKTWEFHVDNKVREFTNEIERGLFINMGIFEYVELDIRSVDFIDENNIRIVYKFRELNLKRIFKWSIFFISLFIILGIVSAIIFL